MDPTNSMSRISSINVSFDKVSEATIKMNDGTLCIIRVSNPNSQDIIYHQFSTILSHLQSNMDSSTKLMLSIDETDTLKRIFGGISEISVPNFVNIAHNLPKEFKEQYQLLISQLINNSFNLIVPCAGQDDAKLMLRSHSDHYSNQDFLNTIQHVCKVLQIYANKLNQVAKVQNSSSWTTSVDFDDDEPTDDQYSNEVEVAKWLIGRFEHVIKSEFKVYRGLTISGTKSGAKAISTFIINRLCKYSE